MHRFFAPDIESDLLLPEEEARHCVKVLRLSEGEPIEVVDGKGNLFDCRVAAADSKHCRVEILDKRHIPPHWGCNITIAVAPTKNLDRMEWMTEKLVEMGVDRIVPLLCHYSERKVLKTERLRKIMVSAMKQSLKTTLPQLDELTPIGDFVKSLPQSGRRFIAYCDDEVGRHNFVGEYRRGDDVVVMIGPEGDFSKDEVRKSMDSGFVPVTLGGSRLRTETAGMFACAAIHTINQM